MIKRFYAIIYIFLIFLSGCQVQRQPSAIVPNKLQPAPPASRQSAVLAPPPVQLDALKTTVDTILNDIRTGNWAAVKSSTRTLGSILRELQPEIKSASIPPDLIDGLTRAAGALDNAVTANKHYDATIQAHELSTIIPDIADYYRTQIPTDIMRLENLSRELTFNIKHHDWPAAKEDLRSASGFWRRLKPTLHAGYKQELAHFQGTINRLVSAINKRDAAAAESEVNKVSNAIAVLKKDFAEQNK